MAHATLRWTLPDARIVGGQRRPLHVRIDCDDDEARVSLGIETRPGTINWQLCLAPEALAAIQERVAWATQQRDST